MADLSITAANVVSVADSGLTKGGGTAGATITAGQPLYIDASDSNKLKPADNDASSATANVVGIALHGASNNQPIAYQKTGKITIGATVAVGTAYVLSSTAGGICPIADLGTGDKLTYIGTGETSSVIALDINPTNITLA